MKRKRFTDEQIIAVLREHEAGAKAGDLSRKHGISEATLHNWKAKYGGMDVSDAKRLKALEDENAKLKKLLADQMLEASALRELLSKNGRAAAKREAVAHLRAVMGLSERRACSFVGADRKMIRYRSRRPPERELRGRLRDLANERRRFGYRRLFILLRREGEPSGINRVYRLYREEALTVRKRRARRRAVGTRAPILVEARPNARWSLDFVHDQFACGRRPAAISFANRRSGLRNSLPPYSPDLNPIKQAFAKIKHWMRQAQKRTIEDTWRHIGHLVSTIDPAE